jgi:hypothetical protein
MTGIDTAFELLVKAKHLVHGDVLGTNKILFEAVYPWAGQILPPSSNQRGVTSPQWGKIHVWSESSFPWVAIFSRTLPAKINFLRLQQYAACRAVLSESVH